MTDDTMLKLCGQDSLSELEETPVTMVMYNQSEVKPLGKKPFKVVNPSTTRNTAFSFILLMMNVNPFLGLRASEHRVQTTSHSTRLLPSCAEPPSQHCLCGFSTFNMEPPEPFANLTENIHPIATKSHRYGKNDLRFIKKRLRGSPTKG